MCLFPCQGTPGPGVHPLALMPFFLPPHYPSASTSGTWTSAGTTRGCGGSSARRTTSLWWGSLPPPTREYQRHKGLSNAPSLQHCSLPGTHHHPLQSQPNPGGTPPPFLNQCGGRGDGIHSQGWRFTVGRRSCQAVLLEIGVLRGTPSPACSHPAPSPAGPRSPRR